MFHSLRSYNYRLWAAGRVRLETARVAVDPSEIRAVAGERVK